MELEGQGCGIIMEVTHLLLLGPFYNIKTNFMYFFAHNCSFTNLETTNVQAFFTKVCLFILMY